MAAMCSESKPWTLRSLSFVASVLHDASATLSGVAWAARR
jgi:hypothetical protein